MQSINLLTTEQIISQAVSGNAVLGEELLDTLLLGYALPEVNHLTSRILAINDSLNYIVMSNPTLAQRQQALDYLLSRLPRPLQARQVVNTLYELAECECEESSTLPLALPPSEGLVDDVNDTFSFTPNSNYPSITSYEVSINNSSYGNLPTGTYATGAQIVIPGLNYVIPAGLLRVRVRANSLERASVALVSLDPFTIAASPVPSSPVYISSSTQNRTFTFAPPSGYLATECAYTIRGGAEITCTSDTINVGPATLDYHELRVYVKANLPKNQQGLPLLNEVILIATQILPTPSAPSISADDVANTLSFSSTYQSDLVVSINGAGFVPYTGPYTIGDVDLPSGYYVAKVKATSTHTESLGTSSPAFNKVPVVTTVTAYVGAFNDEEPTANDFKASTNFQWDKSARSIIVSCEDQRPGWWEPQTQGIRTLLKNAAGNDNTTSFTRYPLTIDSVLGWAYVHKQGQYDLNFIEQLSAPV